MTHDEYRDSPGINWSTLKAMADSPLEYRHGLTHPREDSPAMLLGRAAHCAVLEPDAYAARYVVRPDGIDGRTKAGKAAIEELAASGREVLTADQGALCSEIAAAVRAHPVASMVFDGVETEQTIAWTIDGRQCKGRIDALNRLWLADLKTTFDLGKFSAPRLLGVPHPRPDVPGTSMAPSPLARLTQAPTSTSSPSRRLARWTWWCGRSTRRRSRPGAGFTAAARSAGRVRGERGLARHGSGPRDDDDPALGRRRGICD